MTDLPTTGEHTAQRWRAPLGKAGLAAKGVLYLVLGLLAIQFARGEESGENVSQTGAFETVANQPFGTILLIVLIIGLVALICWHLIQAALGDPIEGDEASDRAKYFIKAVIYVFLAITAVRVLMEDEPSGGGGGGGGGGGDQTERQAASDLFNLPGGRLIVGLLGVILIGVAIYQVKKYVVDKEYMERLAPPESARKFLDGAGRFGYAARAVIWAMIGVFFLIAAIQYDAKESRGLSGSVQELADNSAGKVVLWLVALGFLAFGLFTLAEAKYRKTH